ncbi:MAG: hypothetical protein ACMUHX_05005 [bacterium]
MANMYNSVQAVLAGPERGFEINRYRPRDEGYSCCPSIRRYSG